MPNLGALVSNLITYELPSGKTVQFEVSGQATGATRDFANSAGGTSRGGPLATAMETIGEALEVVARGLDKARSLGPEKVEIELSAEVSSGGVIKFVLGEGKGGLKIKLIWDNAAKK